MPAIPHVVTNDLLNAAKSSYTNFRMTSLLTKKLRLIKFTISMVRVGKGIFVSREWSIFVRVKCEMLDFSVVKCDLFYSRDSGVSLDEAAPGPTGIGCPQGRGMIDFFEVP